MNLFQILNQYILASILIPNLNYFDTEILSYNNPDLQYLWDYGIDTASGWGVFW